MIVTVVGAVLILSPFVIDRLESVSAESTRVEVRFTQKVAEAGAPNVAKALQQTGLVEFAESYAFVHQEIPDDRFHEVRVYLQDLLVERSAAIAQTQKLSAREVRKLLRKGSTVMRVLAIGLMTGDPSLADGRSIVAGIRNFQSKNEQYHALRLADLSWPQLAKPDRQEVHDAVKEAVSNGAIPLGSDRSPLAEAVLSRPLG